MASISYQGLESYFMVQDHVKMHDIADWLEYDVFPKCARRGDIFFVSGPTCMGPRTPPLHVHPAARNDHPCSPMLAV